MLGSGDWIRTSDLVVNSHPLYRWATPEYVAPTRRRSFLAFRRLDWEQRWLYPKPTNLAMARSSFSHRICASPLEWKYFGGGTGHGVLVKYFCFQKFGQDVNGLWIYKPDFFDLL